MSGHTHEHADGHEEETATQLEPDVEALMRAVFRRLGPDDSIDPHTGGKFLALALRGQAVRYHFDAQHPDHIEVGAQMAPPGEADREAWLFGYRFAERKEGA